MAGKEREREVKNMLRATVDKLKEVGEEREV